MPDEILQQANGFFAIFTLKGPFCRAVIHYFRMPRIIFSTAR